MGRQESVLDTELPLLSNTYTQSRTTTLQALGRGYCEWYCEIPGNIRKKESVAAHISSRGHQDCSHKSLNPVTNSRRYLHIGVESTMLFFLISDQAFFLALASVSHFTVCNFSDPLPLSTSRIWHLIAQDERQYCIPPLASCNQCIASLAIRLAIMLLQF